MTRKSFGGNKEVVGEINGITPRRSKRGKAPEAVEINESVHLKDDEATEVVDQVAAQVVEEEKVIKSETEEAEEATLEVNKPELADAETMATREEELIAEKDEYKTELKFWSCICLTLEDWTLVHTKFQTSKKQADNELATLIDKNYLNEMPALFLKYEKDRQQRLMANAPKRQSERLRTCQNDGDINSEDIESADLDGLPLTEQEKADEKVRKETIAKQREERWKQRLLRKEAGSDLNESGEETTAAHFNLRNYFLMQKVMAKIVACKYAWPFKTAVCEEDAPDYYKIIQVNQRFRLFNK